MRQLAFTLMLLVAALSPLAAACQAPPAPANPPAASDQQQQPLQPLTPPDSQWRKIQKLLPGLAITVTSTHAVPLPCRMAAATDDILYCNAYESPDGIGYQFSRASVISVEAVIPRRNHHTGLMAAMIGGGVLFGMAAARGTDAGHAAEIGAIGALVTGAAGAPMALDQRNDDQWVTVIYRPRTSRLTGLPARVR